MRMRKPRGRKRKPSQSLILPSIEVSLTFRAEVMPGRDRIERSFEVTRVLSNGRVELGNLYGQHSIAEFLPLIGLSALLLVFGGWDLLLWGVFLRLTVALHATWLVNSATHMWGRQRFVTGEDSGNSWWVAVLTFGEGWHNNHHAYPTSARHGLRWYEIDMNWLGIRVLQLLGLARGIKRVRFNRAASAWQLVRGRVRARRAWNTI